MDSSIESAKIYIDANRLLNDSFELGTQILRSGFEPTLLIALWRGGTPVGIAIQELLANQNIPHDHYPIKTRHYTGIEQREPTVEIEGLELILGKIDTSSRILIVDDVFDTGLTLDKLVVEINTRATHKPGEIKLATPWYKPANNRTTRVPDYYLHQTDAWIVFPHEIAGLTSLELHQGKPELTAFNGL